MSKTTTEHAAEIRAAYKAKGWSSRKVSVRSDYFSMGSSIDVTIKDPDVPEAEVKRIAEEHSRIHRCEITGDILSGCNRYVSVRYSHEAEATLAGRHEAEVKEALAEVKAKGDSIHAEIKGTEGRASVSIEGHLAHLWIDDRHAVRVHADDARSLALAVARRLN